MIGVELRVEEGLASGDGDDGGAEAGKVVDAAEHLVERDGIGDVVVLVAVGAGQIAAAHGDDLRHDGVARGGEGMADEGELADASGGGFEAAAGRHGARRCSLGGHVSLYWNIRGWVMGRGAG